jgi:outer membrane protein TolC
MTRRPVKLTLLSQVLLFGTLLLATTPQFLAPALAAAPIGGIKGSKARSPTAQDYLPDELLKARALLNDAEQVTMQQAIQSALRQNPSLRGAFSAIQASEWLVIANKRRWLPSAAVQANPDTTLLGQVFSSTIANYPNSTGSSFATSTYNSSYSNFSNYSTGSIGVILNWSFFDPSRQPAINSSEQSLRAQVFTFNVVARGLVLDTQTAYQTLQQNRVLIGIYEEIYHQNKQLLEVVKAQFSRGMTNIGDVEQKQTQLLNQLTQLVLLYRQQAQGAALLASAMGREPGSAVLPAEEVGTPPTWSMSQDATIKEGLLLREEILASLAKSEAARWEARRLVNSYLPVLTLTGTTYGYRGRGNFGANVGQDPAPFFSSQYSSEAVVGLGLRWDFFDGGIRNAQAQQAKSQAQILASKAQDDRLVVASEIRSSYASFAAAQLGLAGAEKAFATARRSVYVANKRYEIGLGNMTDVVQATQLLAEAASNLIALRLLHQNSVSQLYRYSAQWPEDLRPLINQELGELEGRKP